MKGVKFNCVVENSDTIQFDKIVIHEDRLYIQMYNKPEDSYTELEMCGAQVQNLKDFLNENF